MEEDSERKEILVPRGLGQRHVLVLLGFIGFALSYSMRFNLSLAIVAMVNGDGSQIIHKIDIGQSNIRIHHQPGAKNISAGEQFLKDECNVGGDTINLLEVGGGNYSTSGQGEFSWSESQQGFVLSSFFWGYLITQIPGGWLGHKFGGKWPFGLGLGLTALLSIATPFAARIGGFKALVAVRFLQGFAGGVTVPSMNGILAKWIPPDERGKLASFVYSGMVFGTALSLIVSGYTIHYFGWAWVFYLTGGITLIWLLFWIVLTHSTPSEHPHISTEEAKYIHASIDCHQNSSQQHTEIPKRPPWSKVLKSGPFWAVVFGQLTETWGLYTIMTELPTYMKTVLHYDIEQNSLLSAFPYLLSWVTSILLTHSGDFCIRKRYASISTVRKVCNTIGMWGSAAALLGVAYSGCDRTITVTLLSVAVACSGGVLGGVLVNLIDITPNYAGVLMGITNSAGTIPGVLAPWTAGIIIDNDPSVDRWRLVFLITASISFVGNLIFLLLASGEQQSWNNPSENRENSSGNSGSTKTFPPSPKQPQGQIDHSKAASFFTAPVPDTIEIQMVELPGYRNPKD